MKFLKELNEEQYLAATTIEGPLLVLAGAGSGKTKTIVARTAYMIHKNINPQSILVLTFTSKAAKEMKERGETLLNSLDFEIKQMPLFATFHTFGLMVLKNYISKLGIYSDNFTIADEAVQKKIVKRLLVNMFISSKFTESNFLSLSGILQNNLIPYDTVENTYKKVSELLKSDRDKYRKIFEEQQVFTKTELGKFCELFVMYKEELVKNNSLDFDDLINLPIRIFEEFPDVREKMKKRFRYVMIDEFQDTNMAQIKFINLMLNEKDNICVVGDDSQSIYGWRGADIRYILNFHNNYENVVKLTLKKNYRSGKGIVDHANKLINNAEQKHEFKELLTAFKKEQGKIACKLYENPEKEAIAVAAEIKKLLASGENPKDIAVLYRTNRQVIGIEKFLIKEKVPYKIFKGRAILQKVAVQNYLSFFSYFLNPSNELALEMALTSPAKILSEAKYAEILEYANSKNKSVSYVLHNEDLNRFKLNNAQRTKIMSFLIKTKEIQKMLEEQFISTEEIMYFFSDNFFLISELTKTMKESSSLKMKEQAESALNDIGIINSMMLDYKSIREFIDNVTIDGEKEDEDSLSQNKVNLMTIHSSKGLEFKNVFVIGAVQGTIPFFKSLSSPDLLEEERRLFYVAITRSGTFLHVSYYNEEFIFGKTERRTPSQFLFESELLEKKMKTGSYNTRY